MRAASINTVIFNTLKKMLHSDIVIKLSYQVFSNYICRILFSSTIREHDFINSCIKNRVRVISPLFPSILIFNKTYYSGCTHMLSILG